MVDLMCPHCNRNLTGEYRMGRLSAFSCVVCGIAFEFHVIYAQHSPIGGEDRIFNHPHSPVLIESKEASGKTEEDGDELLIRETEN